MSFPKSIKKVIVPPIKCQGIKTKLVEFISNSIIWNEEGIWREPFLGSGVVPFNLKPQRAVLSDNNIHIINFYQEIQKGNIDGYVVTQFLQEEGATLKERGKDHYYFIRERFNENGSSLDFLFLNRSCFNGLMRFNSKGKYNVPFGHKPERFRKAYVTKIKNQVEAARAIIQNNDWEFVCCDWQDNLLQAEPNDFIYIDPPYIGRHTDYFNSFEDEDSIELANVIQGLNVDFAMSNWLSNKYRENSYIQDYWPNCEVKTKNHFYHIGSSENLRNEVIEALVVNRNQGQGMPAHNNMYHAIG